MGFLLLLATYTYIKKADEYHSIHRPGWLVYQLEWHHFILVILGVRLTAAIISAYWQLLRNKTARVINARVCGMGM